jgi:hypothetical protein
MINTLVIQPKNQNVGKDIFEERLPLPLDRYIIDTLDVDKCGELIAI